MSRVRGPSKRTPDTDRRITEALELGATYTNAAGYAGIHVATFERWRNRDAEFAALVQRAEEKAVIGWLAMIQKAAQEGDWRAAAWKLERRHSDQWGRRQRVDVHIRQEAERIAQELGLSVEDVLAEAERIATGQATERT